MTTTSKCYLVCTEDYSPDNLGNKPASPPIEDDIPNEPAERRHRMARLIEQYIVTQPAGKPAVTHIGKTRGDWQRYIEALGASAYRSHLLGAFDAGFHAGTRRAQDGSTTALITAVLSLGNDNLGDLNIYLAEDIQRNGVWAALERYAACKQAQGGKFLTQRDYRSEVVATRDAAETYRDKGTAKR